MGVPRFFVELIEKYKVHFAKTDVSIDYFFIDFNGLIYTAVANVRTSEKDWEKLSDAVFERKVVNEIIKITEHVVCDVVKPNKLLYIAIDGPAPRAKMIQQRSRRFKSAILATNIENKIREKYGMDKLTKTWDPSSNAAPGTKFMKKLSDAIKKKIDSGFFCKSKKIDIIYSDGNVPGEGEHKFLDYIRKMNRESDESVCLYSNDGDILFLAIGLQKKNTYVLRDVKESKIEIEQYEDKEYLYVNIDICRKEIYKDLTRHYKQNNPKINEISVTNDLLFLGFMFGNDFVSSLQFLKIAGGGFDMLFGFYRTILNKLNDNLIYYDMNSDKGPTINMDFLRNIFYMLSSVEDKFMKKLQKDINNDMEGKLKFHQREKEKNMSDYDIDMSRYQHLRMCNSHNPLYSDYAKDFTMINYDLPRNQWKEQYYKYFLGVSVDNKKEYYEHVNMVVKNYLESLIFTLKYYFKGVPSWSWYYQYRVSPIPSDVAHYITKISKDINKFEFTQGSPYTPFQQLMMILSYKQSAMVPKKLGVLMTDSKYLLVQYYPIECRLDPVAGLKYIYSEVILPEIDDELFLPVVKEAEKKLSKTDMARNQIVMEPYVFTSK